MASASTQNVQITVNPGKTVSTAAGADFISLSLQMAAVCQWVNLSNSSSTLANLLKNLYQPNSNSYEPFLNIGGDSADTATWANNNGTYSCAQNGTTVNRKFMSDIFSFISNVDWRTIWTLNLAANNASLYSDEGSYLSDNYTNSNLFAIAIGNQPDDYGKNGIRSANYSYSNFKSEWENYETAILSKSSNAPITGPELDNNITWFTNFANDEHSILSKTNSEALTNHYFPLDANGTGSTAPTIDNLLSSAIMQQSANSISQFRSEANNLQIEALKYSRVNSISGTPPSLGGSFAQALWTADLLFNAREQNVTNVALNEGYGSESTAPISLGNNGATANATYYGMLFTHYALSNSISSPNSGTSVQTTVSSPLNLVAHSIQGTDGRLRVAIINKDQNQDATITINTTNTYSKACALRLIAPSVSSTSNITFGGNAVAANGTWTPGIPETVSLSGATATITIPAGSAAVIIFENTIQVCAITATPTPTPSTYTIGGNVFNDVNKDDVEDNGESNYTGGISITSSGGTVSTSNGSYSISGLSAGTYTVSYTNLPGGYYTVYPKNGPPPSFLVTVGGGCSGLDTTTGASCSNGNVSNLNFAISNANPWVQMIDLDGRIDNGFKTTIPSSANAQCGAYAATEDSGATSPGIPFSGDTQYDFGQGSASSKNWVVGGSIYGEVFGQTADTLKTAYSTLVNTANRAGLTIIDVSSITGCNNLSNCTLPANLANGIYEANGNLSLNSYTFPANKNYIILVNGTLTILGNITVPVGSTALFSSSGDIQIDKGVKAAADSCPAPTGEIQGIFSSDKNFIVEGINDCSVGKDNMLNIEGAVVVNAARGGGVFTNERDLCSNNAEYPSVTVKSRPDFLFNAPSIVAQQSTYSVEQAE